MRHKLRNRLVALFVILVATVGAGTLYTLERTLGDDLLAALDTRLFTQGYAVAGWLGRAGHPARLAPRLADVTGTRITIIGSDGLVQGDSLEPSTVGRPIGHAPEVVRAHRNHVGRAVRELVADQAKQYLVAVPADAGRVVRLAVPMDNILETRARMRNRLLVGFGIGLVGALVLSWVLVRAITRPLQSMTNAAERLARGDYEIAKLESATRADGELGVLARAMTHMVGEVKARVGELTQQRDLLSVVFASLVEGVVVVDRDGAVVLVNDAAKPLLGHENRLPESLAMLVSRASLGQPADAELELVGRTVRATAWPLGASSEAAGSVAVTVVLYDVTRLRSLEVVRREFLSNVAHELRTPVTSISGYAETLLAGRVDSETAAEFLGTIHRNAQRIASLVSGLVLLDQLSGRAAIVGERVAVSLRGVVDDAVRTVRGITADAQIDVDISGEISVLATRDGLDHIVQNLIDNAVKYGNRTPVVVRARQGGTHVQLSVSDAGPGIPAGHEDRIFERFYRVDAGRSRDRGGSGLGLAIVKSQAEAVGGKVWVESANPGARFVVEFEAA